MTVNVVIGVSNDELSEDLVSLAWEAAQRIFRKYGLEVYVIPVTATTRFPYISINGIRVIVRSPPSVEELEDLILSIAIYVNNNEEETELLGLLEEPTMADALFLY